MSFSQKRLLLIGGVLIVFLFLFFRNQGLVKNNVVYPTPHIAIPTPMKEVHEVRSPDGAMSIIMETKDKGQGIVEYTFFIATTSSKDRKTLYTTTGQKKTLSLSPNAWSPDNTYVYILKKENGLQNALVFKGNGEIFSQGQLYLEVLPVFTKRKTDYSVAGITGWDSPTLLHVVTNKDALTKGPSFWFEVPSQALIQLN